MKRLWVLACAAACLLSACGGGNEREAQAPSAAAQAAEALRSAARAPEAPRRRTLAAAGGSVDATDAANQLMDYAETYYPAFFPSHPVTASAQGYTYRYYEATGVYLGVRDGQVYVLGGSFGTEVRQVGALTQFITPAPRVLSALCDAPGAVADGFATPNAAVGKNAGVSVVGCSGALGSPQWRQTTGPSVNLVSDKTQTLSFDPPAAGDYAFEASFTDTSGLLRTQTVALHAGPQADAAARVTVRASLSVRMGGKVSVRAWPTVPAGDAVKAVTWTQIEGPPVTLDTRTSRLALFTAPEVPRDTLIRLRATLYTEQGRSDSDEVMVLVERQVQASANDENAVWAGDHVARTYAYRSSSPYRDVLRRCVYDPALYHSGPRYNVCTLTTLPFLAQETRGAMPTVEQVMDRVLVSHDWLGRNFEDFLRNRDPQGDFRRMLNSVTAIVLATEIRPSFYYAGTGAIYLDADNFWLTPEERDTVNEAPDYRSDFGSALQYQTLWRYVQDNQNIFAYFDPRQRITRTLDDVRHEAAWLLYHELGHALDFLPPAAYDGLNRNQSAWQNIATRYANGQLTSDTVPALYPLVSAEMRALGQVQFHGDTPSAEQRGYTPEMVAGFFSPDLATDDYNYSTQFEDIAMTLEELLMQSRLGIRRDFAITQPRTASTASSSSLIVQWGQRGRVGTASIRPRAQAIALALTPWLDPAAADQLPEPIDMRGGQSWDDNLAQPSLVRTARAPNAAATLLDMQRQQHELQRMQRRAGPARKLPPLAAVCAAISGPTPPRCAAAR
ncbi:hypothetical protein [Aquabacterium sp.]|uniref:hypothetical protein n=1 Tax=Aquabacterium sp. TaxID=1872578 RepID=UPI003782E449